MRLIITILFAMFITGCAWTRTEYIEKPVPYQREPLGITIPAPLELNMVSITLWTPENEPAFFVIDGNSYQNILLNNKRIEGWIRESGARIDACESYYTSPMEMHLE